MISPNYGDRLRLGLLVPCRNTVAEPDANAMAPAGVSVHVNRLRLLGTSRQQLLEMADGVDEAAALLAAAGVDLIAFHCTAASTLEAGTGGELIRRIRQATAIAAIATSTALLAALVRLNARRIVMVTPYQQHINDSEVAFFRSHGVEVIEEVGLSLPDAKSMAAIEPERWYERTVALRRDDADAYFLSCTNIRALPIIERLEQTVGAPVITSNQAMMWHCLRTAGIEDEVPGCGILMRSH